MSLMKEFASEAVRLIAAERMLRQEVQKQRQLSYEELRKRGSFERDVVICAQDYWASFPTGSGRDVREEYTTNHILSVGFLSDSLDFKEPFYRSVVEENYGSEFLRDVEGLRAESDSVFWEVFTKENIEQLYGSLRDLEGRK